MRQTLHTPFNRDHPYITSTKRGVVGGGQMMMFDDMVGRLVGWWGPFKYYVSKKVGGVRKWQFLLIYTTIYADVSGWA